MKTVKTYLVMMLLAVAASIQAQHFITGSMQAGYSGTFDKMDQTKSSGLFGGQIGVGYEWQNEHLLLDLGVEFSYYKHRLKIVDQTITQRMLDTETMAFTNNGQISKRTDDFSSTSFRIPVLAGAQFGAFYFLAGLVPDIHFKGSTAATADLTTWGDYSEFYVPLENMANHGFYTRGISSENDMRYKFDLLGHLEAGVSFGEKHKYKLAVFGEVGMLDIAPRTDLGAMATPDYTKYMDVKMYHPYQSKEGMFANAHNFEVGLKFTVGIHIGDNKEKEDKDDENEKKKNELDSINQAIQDSIDQARLDSINRVRQDSINAAAYALAEQQAQLARRQQAYNDSVARAREAQQTNSQAYNNTFGPGTQLERHQLYKGAQFTLQDIYFDTDLTIVMIPSLPTLKQLYKLLLQYPDLNIKIIGHTDSQGSDAYNKNLSYRRAKSVRQTLLRWGIDENRITIEGRGEREPIADNATAEGRQLNRRVVFEVQ